MPTPVGMEGLVGGLPPPQPSGPSSQFPPGPPISCAAADAPRPKRSRRARAAGASGFIVKSLPATTMLAVIDDVAAGRDGFGPAAAAALPCLSPRQLDVLALLAEGHANKEICYRLDIAERTVRAHLTELFAALGVGTRVTAILRAREIGLIR